MSKIVYERPALIKLQEVAVGGGHSPAPTIPAGDSCSNGSSPSSGAMALSSVCNNGLTAGTSCSTGYGV